MTELEAETKLVEIATAAEFGTDETPPTTAVITSAAKSRSLVLIASGSEAVAFQ